MLTIDPIPAFSDNYIWLIYDDTTGEAFVVDPGDAGPVEALSLIHISEPTRPSKSSRMPSSA